jgi:hypothetical protein
LIGSQSFLSSAPQVVFSSGFPTCVTQYGSFQDKFKHVLPSFDKGISEFYVLWIRKGEFVDIMFLVILGILAQKKAIYARYLV